MCTVPYTRNECGRQNDCWSSNLQQGETLGHHRGHCHHKIRRDPSTLENMGDSDGMRGQFLLLGLKEEAGSLVEKCNHFVEAANSQQEECCWSLYLGTWPCRHLDCDLEKFMLNL